MGVIKATSNVEELEAVKSLVMKEMASLVSLSGAAVGKESSHGMGCISKRGSCSIYIKLMRE